MSGETTYSVQIESVALTTVARYVISDLVRQIAEDTEFMSAIHEKDGASCRNNLAVLNAARGAAKEIWFGVRDARQNTFISAPIPLETNDD